MRYNEWGERPLVTDISVEFEEKWVEVQNLRNITDPFREVYKIIFNLIQKNRKTSTYNQLVLETLGSQPIMLKSPQRLIRYPIPGSHKRPRYSWFLNLETCEFHLLPFPKPPLHCKCKDEHQMCRQLRQHSWTLATGRCCASTHAHINAQRIEGQHGYHVTINLPLP